MHQVSRTQSQGDARHLPGRSVPGRPAGGAGGLDPEPRTENGLLRRGRQRRPGQGQSRQETKRQTENGARRGDSGDFAGDLCDYYHPNPGNLNTNTCSVVL